MILSADNIMWHLQKEAMNALVDNKNYWIKDSSVSRDIKGFFCRVTRYIREQNGKKRWCDNTRWYRTRVSGTTSFTAREVKDSITKAISKGDITDTDIHEWMEGLV